MLWEHFKLYTPLYPCDVMFQSNITDDYRTVKGLLDIKFHAGRVETFREGCAEDTKVLQQVTFIV